MPRRSFYHGIQGGCHDKSGYRESKPGLGVRVGSGRWAGWLALLLGPVRINDSPSFVALQLRFRLW